MRNDRDLALGLLHHRISKAIGLTPALVGVSLVGCAPEAIDRQPIDRQSVGQHEGADEAAPVDTTSGDVQVYDDTLASRSPEAVEEPPVVYVPVVEVLGIVSPGHVVEVVVHDVPVGGSVAVYLGAVSPNLVVFLEEVGGLAVVDPWFVGEAFAGSEGKATLRFLVPVDAALGGLGIQAVADDGEAQHLSSVAEVEVVAVAPKFAALTELHPLTADADLVPGARFRACVPADEYEVCPTTAEFHEWQALEVVSYALDRPMSADLNARGCVTEDAFVGDCCYGVELWATFDGTVDDACIPPEKEVIIGGGGGGGGGGWGDAGRPFVGPEGARYAAVRQAVGWCAPQSVGVIPEDARITERVAQAWIRNGQAEHASVASFSRFVLELMSLGAPAELVTRATRAQADEIRHARDAFGVASTFLGAPVAPGPLAIDGSLDRTREQVLVSAILEGCINETVCAVQVQEAARRAVDPALSELLAATAADELRHAELSWAFVRWMLEQHPDLVEVARETFAGFDSGAAPAADEDAAALAAHGILSDRDLHAVAVDVVARVIVPSARTLLGAATHPVSAARVVSAAPVQTEAVC